MSLFASLTIAEKQIITSLLWFRTRYALFLELDLERKASKENIASFANAWMGKFKLEWQDAFESLLDKKVLEQSAIGFYFTELGDEISKLVEAETPFFQYEYNNFFTLESSSAAHKALCKKVYGMDLSQHGLIDQKELQFLINKLKTIELPVVLDIGCGNGKITEYLAKQVPGKYIGIDISAEGIKAAQERTAQNPNIRFEVANMNDFKIPKNVNAVLFLDTLYYADDVKNIISKCLTSLPVGGNIYAYFSQWIMDEAYVANLLPENTHLGNIFNELNLSYTIFDLTKSGINHWKKKLAVLEAMKAEFVKEGNEDLWNYRYREAKRYANWGDKKYARYLYDVHVDGVK